MPLLVVSLLLATSTIFTPPSLPKPIVAQVKHESNLCSCVSYVRSLVPEAPRKDAINYKPNAAPAVGSVAIFRYKNGVGHVAFVTALYSTGFFISEANYHHCKVDDRWVAYNDPALRGFWDS